MPRGVLKGTKRGPYKKRLIASRLWHRVDKNGPKQPNMRSRCWVWLGPLDWSGAGHIYMRGCRPINPTAYRVAWILKHGDPGSRCILHRCDNRACVRPSHLFPGTYKDNTQDMLSKGRHRVQSGDAHYMRDDKRNQNAYSMRNKRRDQMRLYVAFRTDVEPPTRVASPSFTKLKEWMKEADPGAEFTVVLYDFKPNVENLCKAIVDVTDIDADFSTDYRVNNQGQLREVK